jgi:ABC-type transport system substrate-binding protein
MMVRLDRSEVRAGPVNLQREEFRHAISAAIDRQALVDTVFLEAVPIGRPITPGHRGWFLPTTPTGVRSEGRHGSVGFHQPHRPEWRRFARRQPGPAARFSLLTQRATVQTIAAMVKEHLRRVGYASGRRAAGSIDVRGVGQGERSIYFAIEFDSFDPRGTWISG